MGSPAMRNETSGATDRPGARPPRGSAGSARSRSPSRRPSVARAATHAPTLRQLASALIVIAALAGGADAHQQGVSYSDVRIDDGSVAFDLLLSTHDLALDVDGDGIVTDAEVRSRYPRLSRIFDGALAVEANGTACPLALADSAVTPNELVRFSFRGRCPDQLPIHVMVHLGALTAVDGENLAKIRVGDQIVEHIFTRTDADVVIGAATGGVWPTFRRFFLLGVEHIATGYDHMLFLLALLLVGGGLRGLVAIVTAFTIAHSVTLSLAVLDVVRLPSRLVESAIALSIAWVALENLLVDTQRGRWRITFVFGLMHGFGFASVLSEMHLPRAGLIASLVAFNLGVEAGQLGVVTIAYPLVTAIERSPRRRLLVGLASGAILIVALYWFCERAYG